MGVHGPEPRVDLTRRVAVLRSLLDTFIHLHKLLLKPLETAKFSSQALFTKKHINFLHLLGAGPRCKTSQPRSAIITATKSVRPSRRAITCKQANTLSRVRCPAPPTAIAQLSLSSQAHEMGVPPPDSADCRAARELGGEGVRANAHPPPPPMVARPLFRTEQWSES
jgi:hypothetical protein